MNEFILLIANIFLDKVLVSFNSLLSVKIGFGLINVEIIAAVVEL